MSMYEVTDLGERLEITRDMAVDFLESAQSSADRKMRRILCRHGIGQTGLSEFRAATAQVEMFDGFNANPQLFPELQHDELTETIYRIAVPLGRDIFYGVVNRATGRSTTPYSNDRVPSPRLLHREAFSATLYGEVVKLEGFDFVDEVWAPVYAERFVQAWEIEQQEHAEAIK